MTYDLLDGVRVVELSMDAFAPSAAAVLADWGADVIKVVPPGHKRCIAPDVSVPDGQDVLGALVARADAFITNLPPVARERFRIDPGDLHEVNPGLIYGRATGHGPLGPEAATGGFDHTDFWARTGVGHAATMVSDEFVPPARRSKAERIAHEDESGRASTTDWGFRT